jgi:hypothetical protein
MNTNLDSLLSETNLRDSRAHGDVIAEEVNRLIFKGAGVSVFRGIRDAKLDDDTLISILSFTIPARLADLIGDYLDGDAC